MKKKNVLFTLIFIIISLIPLNIYADEEKKIAYLTFDDGPSQKVTKEILCILKENDIKATFFILGERIKYCPEMLEEIYNEGHSIGLHSYTHDYKKLYKNSEGFINEMKMVEDEIYETIGIRPNIIRFPGGSRGKLTEELLEKLHECGYKVYDWTVSLDDGLSPKFQPEKLVKRGTKIEGHGNQVILAHCKSANVNTYKALPELIKKYKEMGYEFEAITSNTEECIFEIKNK